MSPRAPKSTAKPIATEDALKMIEQLKGQLEQRKKQEAFEALPPPVLRPRDGALHPKVSKSEEETLLELARQSLRQYGTIVPPKEALYAVMDATCPRCGKTAPITTDFGFKKRMTKRKGLQIIPQSWCNDCRKGKDAHPGRFGLAKKRS